MKKRRKGARVDDGIVAEDVSQLVEHIELTGEHPLLDDTGWEFATPADELEDAPLLLDDGPAFLSGGDGEEIAADLELFTETEVDLNRRLLQVEDEQLELAAVLAGERARWEQRVDGLEAELAERNQVIAEREAEIANLSAQLASMTLERDGLRADARDQRSVAGRADGTVAEPAASAGNSAILALRERVHERGRALLVAREEIDRLRADRERLVAGLAERGEFIQRLHERLRALESGYRGGDLRRLLRRFFGGEGRPQVPPPEPEPPAAAAAEAVSALEDPRPRPVSITAAQVVAGTSATPSIGAAAALRRYLIGLDLAGCVQEINQPRISIGRTLDNDLRLLDPTVSRLHAVLKLRGQTVTVIDANSRNGVFVNGVQVRYSKLEDGDLLAFGNVRFRYRVGTGSASEGRAPD